MNENLHEMPRSPTDKAAENERVGVSSTILGHAPLLIPEGCSVGLWTVRGSATGHERRVDGNE